MLGLEFSLPHLINAAVGGLIGAAITWVLTYRRYEQRDKSLKQLMRYLPEAFKDPDAVGIAFDNKGWATDLIFRRQLQDGAVAGDAAE